MDVLVLIDKLDDVVHNARPVPLTDQVRVDREEIYDLLDQMRATIPEEIKQARWIVKERQEMLAEAKREAERIVREAREQQARLISDEEVTKQAERAADEIVEDARTREREIRLGAEDYADEILNTLEVNLQKFLAAVQRGRDRLAGREEEQPRPSSTSPSRVALAPLLVELQVASGADPAGSVASSCSCGVVVEGLAADRAEAGAVGAAEDAGGEGEHGRVVGPAADVELVVVDVGAAQFRVVGPGLVDLARLDLEVERRRLEAAHARSLEVDREVEAEGEAAAGARDLEPHRRRPGLGDVGLAAQLERLQRDRQLEPLALAVGQREAGEVDDRLRRLRGT